MVRGALGSRPPGFPSAPLLRTRMQQRRGAGARAASGAGKGGQGGHGSGGPPSQRERCPGDAFLVSSAESVTADERSAGKSAGAPGAPGAAARPPPASPALGGGSRGARAAHPGAAPPSGEPAVRTGLRTGRRLPQAAHPPRGHAKATRGRISWTRVGSGGHRCRAGEVVTGPTRHSPSLPDTTVFYAHKPCSPINSQTHRARRSPLPNKPTLPAPLPSSWH